MDDLYYWVLRVWHALTSNKKVLVGMAAAVAVVVTVTTVFAAPALSEGESVESSGVASVAVPVVTSSEVPVGPIVEFTIGEVTDSGMLPSSPFYFLKEAGRSLEYAFTFDSVKKANLTLRFANEDALAIHELCLDDEYLDTAQQCIRYQDHFFTSLAWAVKAKKEGADVDALMTSLRNAHHTHRLILAETLTRLPKQFGEAAIGAVAFTSAPFEQVIGWSQGPAEAEVFHTRLENDFASIDQALWWSIESRLGLEPEQAVKLSEAMGVPSVAGGAPIITSLRADSPRLIPGESYLLTCMASDMEDDELSFQWLSTEGTLEADGQSTAVWTAPDETGVYLVTVVVSDDNGNQTNKDIRLVVGETDEDEQDADAGPFSVDGLILEGNLCSEQTWAAEDWLVFQGREVSATCLIDGDAEGLEYEWRCVRLTKVVATDFEETGGDPGTLTGSGQSVTWEAFQGGGYARISVSVSNGNGLVKEESTVIRVTTCASCIN